MQRPPIFGRSSPIQRHVRGPALHWSDPDWTFEEEEFTDWWSADQWSRFVKRLSRNEYLRALSAEINRFLCSIEQDRLPDARHTRRG